MTDKNKAIEAEVIEDATMEIVQTSIIPAKGAKAASLVLFGSENKDRLIKAFVNMEIMMFENDTDGCKKLAKKYAKLEVTDKDDKEGYAKVKAAYSELVKIRTSTDKKRKELNEPYNSIKKGIDSYANDNIIGVLSATEAALKIQKDKFEKWEADEKARLEKEAAERLDARIKELKDAGLTFDGELYVIGDFISMDAISIGKQSDTDYGFFLAKVKAEKKKIDDAAAAAAKKEADEKAAQAAEKERLEKQAKDLRDEKVEAREDKLVEIGLYQDKDAEFFGYESLGTRVKLTYDDVAEMDKAKFNEWLETTKQAIADDKQRIADSEKTPAVAEKVEDEKPIVEDVPTSNGGGRYFGGGGTSTVETGSAIQENEGDKDYISLETYCKGLNAVEIPQLSTPHAAELLAEFRASIKAAENLMFEKLG